VTLFSAGFAVQGANFGRPPAIPAEFGAPYYHLSQIVVAQSHSRVYTLLIYL